MKNPNLPSEEEIKDIVQCLKDAQDLLCDVGDAYDLVPDEENKHRWEVARYWHSKLKLEDRTSKLQTWREE